MTASLYTVISGQTAEPLDLNQVILILQQASGGTEQGKYVAAGNTYVSGGYVSCYIPSLSRRSTPVSMSIDYVDGVVNVTTSGSNPNYHFLTANGFQVSATSNAINGNVSAAGGWTLNF